MSSSSLLAAAATAVSAGLIAASLLKPPRRLRARLGPYLTPSVTRRIEPKARGVVGQVFGPIIEDLAEWVGAQIDRRGDAMTLQRLRQAGWYDGLTEDRMVSAYRMAQLRALLVGVGASILVGAALGASFAVRVSLVILGLVFGVTHTRGRVEKAVSTRQELMKIEIYTVNQLLAMRVRAGGGVIHAVRSTVERGSGEVIGELSEALRLHRSGWRGPDAFRRIAELTPEPFCSRTYRLLASADERGSDLATALLALSEDVRETRRESIKRAATKRRAAMLVPTIAILAPVLILFVAAPLPYLVTGWQ